MANAWRWPRVRSVVSGMTRSARRSSTSSARNPGPISARPRKPRLLLRRRAALPAGRLSLTSDTATRYSNQTAKTLTLLQAVGFPVLICGLIRCSSSTMWTGPWRRAGEQRVRTASPEEPIWSASTTRRRKTSCLCTAKAPASGSASSATQQREASRMCVFTEWTLVEAYWYTAKTTSPHHAGYSWSDGTPVSHTNWGYGEPNDHEGREECVEMVSSTNGTFSWWNDLNCDAHQDWICRITKGKNPILPPVPPSPVPGK